MRIALVKISAATRSELLESGSEDCGDLSLSVDVGIKVKVVVRASSVTVSISVL